MTDLLTTSLEAGLLVAHPGDEAFTDFGRAVTPWIVVEAEPTADGDWLVELARGFDGARQRGLWPANQPWRWAHGQRMQTDTVRGRSEGSGFCDRYPEPPCPRPAPAKPQPQPKRSRLRAVEVRPGEMHILGLLD